MEFGNTGCNTYIISGNVGNRAITQVYGSRKCEPMNDNFVKLIVTWVYEDPTLFCGGG